MVHPVQSVVESLYAAGRCPRLHVNSTCEGVQCPDFIREQWQERLIIDLDTSYPLDLRFTDDGLSAELSFGGYITRCHFPWSSVYVVADRATGRGIVLDKHVPESVKRGREKQTTGPWTTKTDLRPVVDEEQPAADQASESEAAPAKRSEGDEVTRPDAPVAAASPTGEAKAADSAPAKAKAKGDEASKAEPEPEAVQKRRAAFRVIDGGT